LRLHPWINRHRSHSLSHPHPHPHLQDYANGIGYIKNDGRYGYFYDKPSLAEKKNKTKEARMLMDQEVFNGGVRKLKAERKLSVSNVNGLLSNFAPDDMFGPTRIRTRRRWWSTAGYAARAPPSRAAPPTTARSSSRARPSTTWPQRARRRDR